MIRVPRPVVRRTVLAIVSFAATACVAGAFQRSYSAGQWSDAARAFDADSSLMNDEDALYTAAVLYSSPSRGVYDPARGARLFQRLVDRFPSSRYRLDAIDRLASARVAASRDSLATIAQGLANRIVVLNRDLAFLRASVDSLGARGDSVQRVSARLENELKERDEQLRSLRLELSRLKEIDLKPRPAGRPPTH